ncbi:hypothetical protein BC936DRAFT_146859 [Jimgerdemannia flammicorona]|uniref:GIY-YIG domain-containing protein n=1 Tax=Jimgerdemannia flammicorona TaxID=994334 RepID=A0A433D6N1_9FUNG|nr:hypothetical protein BC936DRAFT_146859 [Jimgerdemannia flammicorona]
MREHFLNSSNIHLRNAISHYGIASFVFIVIEFIERAATAGSALGLKLTQEQRLKLSAAMKVPFPTSFVFCEEFLIAALPCVIVFGDLHLTEKIKEVRNILKGNSGIYCFTCTITGTQYLGSAVDLYDRFYDHIMGHSSNAHLQHAIAKYGLNCFVFSVVEFCAPSDLLMHP